MNGQHDGRHAIAVDIQVGCTSSGEPRGTDRPSTVGKAAEGADGLVVLAWLPPAASEEGNAGERWYHGGTTPYTHDEEQRAGPRYLLWVSERMHARTGC